MFFVVLQVVGALATFATVALAVVALRDARKERADERAWQYAQARERALERLRSLAQRVERIRATSRGAFSPVPVIQAGARADLRRLLRELNLEILGSPDRLGLPAARALAAAALEDTSAERLRGLIDAAELELGLVRDQQAALLEAVLSGELIADHFRTPI